MRRDALAGFALFALANGAMAATAPRCNHEPSYPPSFGICLAAVDDGWDQVNFTPFHASDPKPPVIEAGAGTIAGEKAIYLSGDAGTGNGKRGPGWGSASYSFTHGGLERRIPLESWRGKRVSLTLRLKNEGGAHAWTSVQLNKSNETVRRTSTRYNNKGDAWQTHVFTLDVPDNATELFVLAGMTGMGRIWLDGFTLQAVNRDVPVSWSRREINCGAQWPATDGAEANYCYAALPATGPGPTRRDGL